MSIAAQTFQKIDRSLLHGKGDVETLKKQALKKASYKSPVEDREFLDLYLTSLANFRPASKKQQKNLTWFLRQIYREKDQYASIFQLANKLNQTNPEKLNLSFWRLMHRLKSIDKDSLEILSQVYEKNIEEGKSDQCEENLIKLVQIIEDYKFTMTDFVKLDSKFSIAKLDLSSKDFMDKVQLAAVVFKMVNVLGFVPEKQRLEMAGLFFNSVLSHSDLKTELKHLKKIQPSHIRTIVNGSLDQITDYLILPELAKRYSHARLAKITSAQLAEFRKKMRAPIMAMMMSDRDMSRLAKNYNYALPSLFLNLARQIHDDVNDFTDSIRKYSAVGSWARLIQHNENPRITVSANRKLNIVGLVDSNSLSNESDIMNHCIGRLSIYREQGLKGTHHYFSIRSDSGERLSTMDFYLGRHKANDAMYSVKIPKSNYYLSLIENRGVGNSAAPPEARKAEKLFMQFIEEGKIKIKTPDNGFKLGAHDNDGNNVSSYENATGTRFADAESFSNVEGLAWLRLALPENTFWGKFGLDENAEIIESASKDPKLANTDQVLKQATRESKALGELRRRKLIGKNNEANPIDKALKAKLIGSYYPVDEFADIKSPHGVGNWSNDKKTKFYDNRAIPLTHVGNYHQYQDRGNTGTRFQSLDTEDAVQDFIRKPVPFFKKSLMDIAESNFLAA